MVPILVPTSRTSNSVKATKCMGSSGDPPVSTPVALIISSIRRRAGSSSAWWRTTHCELKWVSSPQWERHWIFVELIHSKNWGELTHLRAVGWSTGRARWWDWNSGTRFFGGWTDGTYRNRWHIGWPIHQLQVEDVTLEILWIHEHPRFRIFIYFHQLVMDI